MNQREFLALKNRRRFLSEVGSGIGMMAMANLLGAEGRAADSNVLLPKAPHFPAKAKRVIQIFACGGVSHVDTFDYKPELAKHHGKELTGKGKIDTFFGRPGRLMRSPSRQQQLRPLP